METINCSVCERTVNVRTNKFGDKTYARHKLATAYDEHGRISNATNEDLRKPHDPNAAYTYELDCPNSGQPT